MTRSLEKAFAKASSLPEAVQEQLAEQMLGDMEGELKWDEALADSQDLLERLAAQSLRTRQQSS